MSEKAEHCKRTTKRRPESAQTPSSTIRGNSARRSGSLSEGRVKHQIDETEKDIALAIHLLQERLGIDKRGIVWVLNVMILNELKQACNNIRLVIWLVCIAVVIDFPGEKVLELLHRPR